MKNATRVVAIVLCAGLMTSCAGMNKTQQRVLSGAAIGAGVGTAGTMMTGGCVSCGAAIGAAAGAVGGVIVDQVNK